MPLDATESEIKNKCAKMLHVPVGSLKTFNILRRSLDARKKNDIKYVYSVELGKEVVENKEYVIPKVSSEYRPIIVGFGPAGMISAYILAKAGLRPLVFERGESAEKRTQSVEQFRTFGILNTESNAQFGEGGAGAFSDGKLTTGVGEKEKSRYILNLFVEHGADKSILIDAKPHIGTDKLLPMVISLRKEIERLGGEVFFGKKVTDIVFDNGLARVIADGEYITDSIVLAIGHSARDTYKMLYQKGLEMESKAFSMGFRVEHLQNDINRAMYGESFENPLLPPAEYKLVKHTENGGVYTFCMCPGGYVMASSSENGGIVTNGMSYHARNGKNANSAVLTTVDAFSTLFGGMEEQIRFERLAYELGGGNFNAPCQLLGDFISGRGTTKIGKIEPTYKPDVNFARLDKYIPEKSRLAFVEAFASFGKSISGFDIPDAVLTGFETRSSAPLRILRNENFCSTKYPSVYPCGEGCGYAGGIMSAAIDGFRVAEAIISKYQN